MAKYIVPGQNLSFDVPNEGEVFKSAGAVYARSGNTLHALNLESLGQTLFDPKNAPADAIARAAGPSGQFIGGPVTYQHLSSAQRQELGIEALKKAGIDYNSLATRNESNLADINSAFSRLGGVNVTSDLSLFKSAPTNQNEVITQSPSAANPQGADIKSNVSGEIVKTPSVVENLVKSGAATPDQANVLAAAEAGGKPVSPEIAAAVTSLPAPKAPAAIVAPATTTSPTTGYAGPSIVDYLSSLNLPTDFASRANLAAQNGISNYFGTADQNTQLLGLLRAKPPAAPVTTTAPAGVSTETKSAVTEVKTPAPAGTQTSTDPQSIIKAFSDQVNADATKEQKTIANGTTAEVRASTKLLGQLVDVFTAKANETPPKTLVQTYNEQRAALGVDTLQTQVSDIDAKIAKLDNEYKATQATAENRVVSTTQIRRGQTANEIAYQRDRSNLLADKNVIVNQLDQKYGVLNTIVSLTGQDMQTANQAYQQKFTQVTTLYNALKGEETAADTRANLVRDDARANLTIMSNLLKGGNVTYGNLPDSTKVDIKKMEVAAGYPAGFTEFVSKSVGAEIVSPLTGYVDDKGVRIQPVLTKDGAGNYSIKNITLGPASSASRDQNISKAQEYVNAHPTASDVDLRVELSKPENNFSAGDINTVLAARKFLTQDYIIKNFPNDYLKKQAEANGYTAGGTGIFKIGVGPEGINDYLTKHLLPFIAQERANGKTDAEILKEI